ncbi:hypothetical protein DACRYDRAFT_21742 [Dacryopinax primogenitus]|uniref:Uncharacterized protein n=1 Tax=Dacryopinax primogenitus (strain DJM 731) TaxID=1858805 RepID=M5G263_DACPD|nr:uncharacterized protein DACRYDRAFT_21742 [Dacryopinax primogenitus]EJU02779.1 hypothetical protein DACRYDRAFT_21742 [Dacryopinax primogenitus]
MKRAIDSPHRLFAADIVQLRSEDTVQHSPELQRLKCRMSLSPLSPLPQAHTPGSRACPQTVYALGEANPFPVPRHPAS